MKELTIPHEVFFQDSASEFVRFLRDHRKAGLPQPRKGAQRACLFIGPWLFTQVSWFAMTLGILLRRRGLEVVFIYDDFGFSGTDADTALQVSIIDGVLKHLPGKFEVVRLKELQPDGELSPDDQREILRLANLNAIWTQQTAELTPRLCELEREYARKLTAHLPYVRAAFLRVKADWWLTPHGIHGNSGLFFWESQRAEVRMGTYDGEFGMIFASPDSIAGQQMDLFRVWREQGPLYCDPKIRSAAIAFADEQLLVRAESKDFYGYQKVKYSSQDEQSIERPFDVLMPLNVDFDCAALGRTRLFASSFDWMMQTAEFILHQTAGSLVIRQHPVERTFPGKTVFRRECLKEKFGNSDRLYFVGADDDVNSYRLLDKCKTVLPLTSTFGIEAAAFGKKVIVESNSFYSQLPFVERAESRDEYFSKIAQSIKAPSRISKAQADEAKLCLFLCIVNMIYSNFTPQPKDFPIWSKLTLSQLEALNSVQDMLFGLERNVPLSLLNGGRILGVELIDAEARSLAPALQSGTLQRGWTRWLSDLLGFGHPG